MALVDGVSAAALNGEDATFCEPSLLTQEKVGRDRRKRRHRAITYSLRHQLGPRPFYSPPRSL